MHSPKNFYSALFPNICSLILFSACHQSAQPEAELTHTRLADKVVELAGAAASYVRVEPAAAARNSAERSLVGRVVFDDRKVSMLGPPVQGRVASVNVLTGDRVAKGALLLTIRAPDIAAASAQLETSKTARMLAQRNADRARLLVEQGAGTEAERLQAEAALAQARAEEQRASSALSALGGTHGANEYQLRAPMAGIVVERNVSVGTEVHVDQDKPLITVADLSTVWVLADVYEQDLAKIHPADEARVHVVAFPEREFLGSIGYVGSTVDAQTRVASARIELANPDLALRPGMFANVQVKGLSDGVVDIPMSGVLARRDQFFVFVRDTNGAFAQREVKPGEQHGEHVAITSGLLPGEQVVTDGAILLDAEANEAL